MSVLVGIPVLLLLAWALAAFCSTVMSGKAHHTLPLSQPNLVVTVLHTYFDHHVGLCSPEGWSYATHTLTTTEACGRPTHTYPQAIGFIKPLVRAVISQVGRKV